jgi:hypothetical protein
MSLFRKLRKGEAGSKLSHLLPPPPAPPAWGGEYDGSRITGQQVYWKSHCIDTEHSALLKTISVYQRPGGKSTAREARSFKSLKSLKAYDSKEQSA